jgi:peroxiredoxin
MELAARVFPLLKGVSVKRTAAFVVVMVAGISLMLWAGWHNLRERRLAAQKAQENHVVLVPDTGTPAEGTAQGDHVGGTTTAQEEPLKGKPAPAFTLVNLDGKKVSLSDYRGRPVIVNFWATWCAPCKLEMPWFEEFRAKYAGQGFEILGIAEDDAPKDEIAKTAKRVNVSYPILLTDGKVAPAYGGVDELPTSFYIDRKGLVETETIGLASKDEVEANIKRLVGAGGEAPRTAGVVLPVGARR